MTTRYNLVRFTWLAGCLAAAAAVFYWPQWQDKPSSPVNAVQVSRETVREWTLKPIEDVEVGDTVVACDETTGRHTEKPVLHLFRNVSDHVRVLEIQAASGDRQVIQTTDGHPFWTIDEGWVLAGSLKSGDRLLLADKQVATVCGVAREAKPNGVPIYNFEVADVHTYFVAECIRSAPLLVHNTSRTCPTSSPDFLVTPEGVAIPRRAHELGFDPSTGFRPNEGLAGTRLEDQLGRQVQRSPDIDFDLLDPGDLGNISVKGPLVDKKGRLLPPKAIESQLDNLAAKTLRDLHPSSGADTVVLDLFGLTPNQAARVRRTVQEGLPANPNRLVLLEP